MAASDAGFAAMLDLAESSAMNALEIGALAATGVTRGCDPLDNTPFCPHDLVTRGQMAAFLHRLLG